jgi:hypothetical protein
MERPVARRKICENDVKKEEMCWKLVDKNIAIYRPAGFCSTPSQVLFLRWCVCFFSHSELWSWAMCIKWVCKFEWKQKACRHGPWRYTNKFQIVWIYYKASVQYSEEIALEFQMRTEERYQPTSSILTFMISTPPSTPSHSEGLWRNICVTN